MSPPESERENIPSESVATYAAPFMKTIQIVFPRRLPMIGRAPMAANNSFFEI